jgi:hypothetical protein
MLLPNLWVCLGPRFLRWRPKQANNCAKRPAARTIIFTAHGIRTTKMNWEPCFPCRGGTAAFPIPHCTVRRRRPKHALYLQQKIDAVVLYPYGFMQWYIHTKSTIQKHSPCRRRSKQAHTRCGTRYRASWVQLSQKATRTAARPLPSSLSLASTPMAKHRS